MNKSIVPYLEELPDERRRAGQRHEQTVILLLVLMSTMSGYHGYRSIGDFITRNRADLLTHLKPKKGRLPTFYTVRRVIQNLDFDMLSGGFYKWARQHTDIAENEWLHVDGKAMKGTMSDYSLERQRFVNLVSVYSSRKKMVLGNAFVDNGKESEIPVVQRLIEDLGLSGVTFTLDALHCQKKL
jgi:hypothetical protein